MDFFRFHLRRSQKLDTTASSKEIELVSAAKMTIRKKIDPITLPAFMEAKIFGREINIRPGPADMPSFPIISRILQGGIVLFLYRISAFFSDFD